MNIKELAAEAGFLDADDKGVWITDGVWDKELTRFAELVTAHEREECAKVCDERVSELYASRDTVDCAEYLAGQIRARSKA